MALVSQQVDNLLNGVSQQPAKVRSDSQAAAQVNAFADPARGLRKRPPTQHKMLLDANGAAYEGAMVHPIHRDETERYHVIVTDGGLKVFDVVANAEASVTAPEGFGYLADSEPSKDIRAVTVGDTTFITNRKTETAKLTKIAPALRNEALVVVRAVDFSTLYTIGLNTPGTTVPTGSGTIEFVNGVLGSVEVLTPVGDQPDQRASLRTDVVAAQLIKEIQNSATLSSEFVVAQYGSAIHIRRVGGGPFNVTVSDGLGNDGMLLIQQTINNADDLPPQAPAGYTVHVLGSLATPTDDFYLTYEPGVSGFGAWKETIAPGVEVGVDPSTMPHVLVRREKPLVEEAVGYTGGLLPALMSTFPTAYLGEWFGPGPAHAPLDPSQNLDLWTAQHDVNGYAGGQLGAPTGGRGTISMAYDVDTTQIPDGAGIDVVFDVIGSGVPGAPQWSAMKTYGPGLVLSNEVLSVEVDAMPSNLQVLPTIAYHRVPGGTDDGFAGLVTLHSQVHAQGPGLVSLRNEGTRVVFDPTGIYPHDGTFTFTVNSTVIPLNYVQPGSANPRDLTAAEVVQQLVAGMPAGITVFNIGAHEFTVTKPGVGIVAPSDGAVQVTSTGSGLSGVLPNVTMHPGEFVGETLTNESTGATGTVTANTEHRITVGALTGGSRQTILPGDVLSVTAAAKFTFGPQTWAERRVGDDTTNPFPSLIGSAITEVFVFAGRIGFVSGEKVLLSAADDPTNLFRHTATDVLDSDPIDVTRASQRPGAFHSALSWDGDMYLFTDSEQYKLSGEPLTPSSIALPLAGRYKSSSHLRPIQLGQRMWSVRPVKGFCEVLEYSKNSFNSQLIATARTQHVPTYLAGNPVQIAGDDALGFLAVLTDGNQGLAGDTGLYVYQYVEDDNGLKQAAWSRWTFPNANVVGIDLLDGALALVLRRSSGLYLETIDVSGDPSLIAEYADRQGSGAQTLAYPFTYTLSPLYLRSQGRVVSGGRLQLRYVTLSYVDTESFTVTVTPVDGSAASTAFVSNTPASGDIEIPILEHNEDVTISLSDSSTAPCTFTGFTWEGWYTQRTRRV